MFSVDPLKVLSQTSDKKNEKPHTSEEPDFDPFNESATLSALQALKYESEDPDANALSYKEEGNYHYKRKEFKKAVLAYSSGLGCKPSDLHVAAILTTNRALCHYYLENYGSCLRDCKSATKLYPKHLKAYIYGARSSMSLSKMEDTLQFCEDGLQYFPENEELSQLQINAMRKQVEIDRLAAVKVEKEKRDITEQEQKFDILRGRGIAVNFKLPPLCLPDSANVQFFVDLSDRLHWSLLLMYPESGQTDFLTDVVETSTIRSCLEIVFDPAQPAPSWDTQRVYSSADDSLEVYYESAVEGKMEPFPVSWTLKKLTRHKGFFVRRDLVVAIHVVSRNSAKFHSRWKEGLE